MKQMENLVPNEPLIFNGIENSRVSVAVTDFGIRDVKSIFGGRINRSK